MADPILIALNAAAAVLYAAVGLAVWRRRPQSAGRPAATAFASWWVLLGAISAAGLITQAIGAYVGWTFAAYMAYLQFVILVIVLALACLMYYLVYLYTGSSRAWFYIVGSYTIYYFLLLYYIYWAGPIGLEQTASGTTTVEYARDTEGHPFSIAISALLILPIIAAAVAYFSLIRKVDGRSQKFRIAVVGGSLAVWFTISFLGGTIFRVGDTAWWPFVSSVVSLIAAYAILVAYAPPRWLRQRFALHGFGNS